MQEAVDCGATLRANRIWREAGLQTGQACGRVVMPASEPANNAVELRVVFKNDDD
jgi:hypothetical protein